jgi:AraC family transcriptional regulator
MAVIGRGSIVAWEGASLWVFAGTSDRAETDPHSHHAIQLTLALQGTFQFRTSTEARSGPAVAVLPDAVHTFEANGVVAHLFIEPESTLGRALVRHWFVGTQLQPLSVNDYSDFMSELRDAFDSGNGDLLSIGQRVIGVLSEGVQRSNSDDRVNAIVEFVGQNLEEPIALPVIAAHVGLSKSRASHLFVEHTGMPLRSYILWRRLERAVEMYSEGSTLTEAAHGAGFADSAHLSRTFRRMFGIPATALHLTAAVNA